MFKKIGLLVCIIAACTFSACTNKGANMGKGKEIALSFDSNPTTGYDWVYEFTKEGEGGVLELVSNDYVSEAANGIVGAGGIRTFKFKATKEGEQEILFTYKRPWEGGETAYDVLYTISIDKNLNITCLGKTKGMVNSDRELSSFPDPIFE